jgi:hypothetical protein
MRKQVNVQARGQGGVSGQAKPGRKFLVQVTGRGHGRGRFVERRLFLTPWKCQAQQFDSAEGAQALLSTLAPAAGERVAVVAWDGAKVEDISGPEFAKRWVGCPKIAARVNGKVNGAKVVAPNGKRSPRKRAA